MMLHSQCQSLSTFVQVVALPWREMVKSLPLWGLLMGALGYDFGFYTLLTELPTYLKNIQHFNMDQVGEFACTVGGCGSPW